MRILLLLLLTSVMFAAEGQHQERPELTREVFIERAAERFDRADTNNDGVLSRAESRAWREARPERREARREQREERRERREERRDRD